MVKTSVLAVHLRRPPLKARRAAVGKVAGEFLEQEAEAAEAAAVEQVAVEEAAGAVERAVAKQESRIT